MAVTGENFEKLYNNRPFVNVKYLKGKNLHKLESKLKITINSEPSRLTLAYNSAFSTKFSD